MAKAAANAAFRNRLRRDTGEHGGMLQGQAFGR